MKKQIRLLAVAGLAAASAITAAGCSSKQESRPSSAETGTAAGAGRPETSAAENEQPQPLQTPRPLHERKLPLPDVAAGSTDIPLVQDTYCWGTLGCADYAGGSIMLKGKTPTEVPAGAAISIHFNYDPEPNEVHVLRFEPGKQNERYRFIEIPLKDHMMTAPDEPGVYYYGVAAYWKSADGKYSKGDTSVDFTIEVK